MKAKRFDNLLMFGKFVLKVHSGLFLQVLKKLKKKKMFKILKRPQVVAKQNELTASNRFLL